MELALIFLAGVSLGISIVSIIFKAYFVGTLRVDKSDPDESYMFLELDKGMGSISSKKHVILRVKLENYISHK